MPPIPIYSDAPIVASKPDGITPQTANTPTRTTNHSSSMNDAAAAYPAARPGAAAFSAPTGSVSKPPPPPATRTSQVVASDGPPAPQPGAVPVAVAPSQTTQDLPPAPSAGPVPQTSQQSSAQMPITSMPPQSSIPTPQISHLATRSTIPDATANPSASAYGLTSLPLGDVPQVPPPGSQFSAYESGGSSRRPSRETLVGYVQNPYASELSAAQRSSLEAQEAQERSRLSIGSFRGLPLPSLSGSGGSAGEFQGDGAGDGVWSTVKGWASTAGNKAAELEEEVWKRMNGK